MHREYVHDCIRRDYEHRLPDVILIAQESIQYLFFRLPGKRIYMVKDLRKINKYKIKKEFIHQ